MQVEAVGRLAVKTVAHDGAVQAVGVRGMYAQLVGAARERAKLYAGAPISATYYLI